MSFMGETILSELRGSNYDLVTYEAEYKCDVCSTYGDTTYTERHLHDKDYKDIDEPNYTPSSPTRFGS